MIKIYKFKNSSGNNIKFKTKVTIEVTLGESYKYMLPMYLAYFDAVVLMTLNH